MNVLFTSSQINFFRHFEDVARVLRFENGCGVNVVFDSRVKNNVSDKAVRRFLHEAGSCDYETINPRSDHWARMLQCCRGLRSYAKYLNPNHTSPDLAPRVFKELPARTRSFVESNFGKWILKRAFAERALSLLESVIPADAETSAMLKRLRPDVVVSVSSLLWNNAELDCVKAAKQLGIPTITWVASWDNLTTKMTFNVIPDLILVWNEALKKEAVSIHGAPPERICVTGSPGLDYLFRMKPSCSRAEFCAKAGLGEDKPFLLYLGSSSTIAGDESDFVGDIANFLGERSGIRTLVRMHPLNTEAWKSFSNKHASVWPAGTSFPDLDESRQDYFDSIYHSSAIAGVNTSAMLEAAIIDKPCITILSERYRRSQTDRGHFSHLSRAGFLEVANSLEELDALVSRILRGEDRLAANRRRFVQDFIRPRALDIPVSSLVALIVSYVADGKTPLEIEKLLQKAVSKREHRPQGNPCRHEEFKPTGSSLL